jgi:hypothetical protein
MQAFSLIIQQFSWDTQSFPAAIGVRVDSPKVEAGTSTDPKPRAITQGSWGHQGSLT